MDWFLHNPIADMPGPHFLLLYGGVIVAVVVEAVWATRRNDRTGDLEPRPIPSKIDPHEIAFLRGGESELTRLIVFDLLRRGYLRLEDQKRGWFGVKRPQKIEQSPDAPSEDGLTVPESKVYQYFAVPRLPQELFQPGGLVSRLKFEPLEKALQADELLSPPGRYMTAKRVWISQAFVIVTLFGYKLAVALAKGRSNVVFMVLLMFFGLAALGVACIVPRLTRRGKDYLKQLQLAFADVKDRVALASEKSPASDPALLLAPALFGIMVLSGTPYDYVNTLFKVGASGGAGGCGGGCGGGGCGGGCGGCGG